MSNVPQNLKYTPEHEWADIKDTLVTIGITDHAQKELGDIVFVELPKVGAMLQSGKSFGTIEAVKTVAELYSPVNGKVLEINTQLSEEAGVINQDPYGQGWIVRVEMESAGKLLSPEEYQALI